MVLTLIILETGGPGMPLISLAASVNLGSLLWVPLQLEAYSLKSILGPYDFRFIFGI